MRAAPYLRVSTRDRGQDVENQRKQLREYCQAQQWQVVAEYEDQDSGAKSTRAAFQRMLEEARQRKFDVLVFWAVDRFSREGVTETLNYLQRLTAYGVEWRSHTEQYLDSCGVFRDAVLAILAAIAKQERVRLRERVQAGLDRARAKGTRSGNAIGRPRRAVPRDRIVELRGQGHSWRTIAQYTCLGVGTVRRAYQGARGAATPGQNALGERP
jgi:DNA invertase Pin-like site-specific DNA recombinase